jgi:hypothetical protein
MPQFPADLERPYGSLCGEGFCTTEPTDSDLLTVLPALRKMLVAMPQDVAELIEAYLPVSPDPPRRCHLWLYNHIDQGLGVCSSYCKALAPPYLQPGYLMWHFVQHFDFVEAAITEHALAVAALEKEMERVYPSAMTEEDRLRPIVSALDRDALVALARSITGIRILLDECKHVLESTEDDPSALGVVFQPIMSLQSYWEPVFGSYKRMRTALARHTAVPQKPRGKRGLDVDVAAFLAWINVVKDLSAVSGVDPSDTATWTEEFWDRASQAFASHLREKRTIRDEKRRSDG